MSRISAVALELHILIESPGESIDVEVIPADAHRDVGLVVGPAVNHPIYVRSYQRRVTVSGGEVWIFGAPGKVTLTAQRR